MRLFDDSDGAWVNQTSGRKEVGRQLISQEKAFVYLETNKEFYQKFMENFFKPGKAQAKAMAGILQKWVAYGHLTLYAGKCESRPIGNTIFLCVFNFLSWHHFIIDCSNFSLQISFLLIHMLNHLGFFCFFWTFCCVVLSCCIQTIVAACGI